MPAIPGANSHTAFITGQAIARGARWAVGPRESWQLVQLAGLQVDELKAQPGTLIATLKIINDLDHSLTMPMRSEVVLGVPYARDSRAAWFAYGATVRVFEMLRAGGACLTRMPAS